MTDEDSQSGAVPDTEQVDESQTEQTPTNIQTTDDTQKFEDISLPNNSEHKAVIEVYYKRYFYIFTLGLLLLIGGLFGTGIVSLDKLNLPTVATSAIIIPLFILFWLFENRVNS